MALKGNFNSVANSGEEGIAVTGTTTLLDGHKLVARHVSLQQGLRIAHGPATLGPQWKTEPRLPKEGFALGEPALATGLEVYVAEATQPGSIASFVTLTWAENIDMK